MAFLGKIDTELQEKIAAAKARLEPQVRGDKDEILAAKIEHIRKSGGGLSGRDFERLIGRNDLLPVNYLERGYRAARAVGRIGDLRENAPEFWGTGFLVAPNLILTNQHVIADPESALNAIVEFDFERDAAGKMKPTRRFRLRPDLAFFASDSSLLDYALIGVEINSINSGATLTDQGFMRLSAGLHKVEEHQFVSLIQHPNAEEKYISIRENKVIQIGNWGLQVPDQFIWYVCDTAWGCSGSPVYNDQWQVVALHHRGVPEARIGQKGIEVHLTNDQWVTEEFAKGLPDDAIRYEANEGVRISAIVRDLKSRVQDTPSPLIQALLDDIDGKRSLTGVSAQESVVSSLATPALYTEERKIRRNRYDVSYFNGRGGYDPNFLGELIRLPEITARALKFGNVARVAGRDDGELKYEHFSIVFNATRRMAFFTAVNIDGKQSSGFDRESDKWYYDPRIDEDLQIGDEFYGNEQGPNSNYFDRGHLVRRLDPVWGKPEELARANQDTFTFTNCAPQYFTFNQRSAFWQGLENFILSNTDGDDLRASVFTGPIFIDDTSQMIHDEIVTKDEVHRGVPIPQAFWKVVVVVDDQGKLYSSAYIVSQAKWAKNIPFERLPVGQHNGFQVSVRTLQDITGIVFDAQILTHDVGTRIDALKPLRGLADIEHPRRRKTKPYGTFQSFESFLNSYVEREDGEFGGLSMQGLEAKRRKRERDVVEIRARIVDYQGAEGLHQHAILDVEEVVKSDPDIAADLQRVTQTSERVFLAIRFGDRLGIPEAVPGLANGVEVRLQGEWIPRDRAYAHGGEKMSVIHFTHRPLGFVCTNVGCFD